MDVNSVKDIANPLMLSQRIQTSIDSIAGQHVNMPSINILLQTIHDLNPMPFLINTIIILIIAFLTYSAAKFVDKMLKNYIPKVASKVEMKMDETFGVMIRRIASASIYIIGLMLIILQIPQLHSLATVILASAGLAGLAIGYAAKDSLANFTAGIFIAIFRPFRVGDWVDFRGDYGVIEDLTLRHTVILTKDYRRIIVPNNIMSNEPIINWTIKNPIITWHVDFDLANASDIERAKEIILEEAKRHPSVLKDRVIKVLVTDARFQEINLKLYIDIPGREKATDIASEIREAARKRFEAEGIKPAKRED
jgi:small conductance mechanosensitive channel